MIFRDRLDFVSVCTRVTISAGGVSALCSAITSVTSVTSGCDGCSTGIAFAGKLPQTAVSDIAAAITAVSEVRNVMRG